MEVLVRKLGDIHIQLAALRGNDQPLVVEIGAALEEIAVFLPDNRGSAREAVQLCLNAMQVIYEQSLEKPETLCSAIADVLAAVERILAEDGSSDAENAIQHTSLALRNAVDEAIENGMSSPPVPGACESENSQTMNLDNVAALLLQMEVGDQDDLRRISNSLRKIAESGSLSDKSKQLILQATHKADETLAGGIGATGEFLTEVMSLLSAVMDDREDCDWGLNSEDIQSQQESSSTPSSPCPPTAVVDRETLPADADLALIGDFITECEEYIQGAEAALLSLETGAQSMEAVNTVFRAFHTIKGTSAFLGLPSITELAHRAESLLSRVRDGEIRCIGGYADLALRSADMLRELAQSVRIALTTGYIERPDGYNALVCVLSNPEAEGVSEESNDDTRPPRLGDILVATEAVERDDIEAVASARTGVPIGEVLVKSGVASGARVAKALRTQKQLTPCEQSSEGYIRVRMDRLDGLIDIIGELVIAESMVAQDDAVVSGGNHELSKKVGHLNKIVRDLQDLGMSMRMVPLKVTFQKMARMVRDLAQKNGKVIDFITEGEDTEIDRNMVDLVNDPLVHMVRNAVDHGIELPDVRESLGKARTGTVRLSSYHSGGNVIVEMKDDGKGLSREKIVEKAIQKGLINSDKGMADSDVYNLIFMPGFSTADKVTEISGRGVGLDVVKRNIESLRGRVEILSEPGNGCTFIMRLPLTMAVTDGMLVKVGTQRFIVPTVSIRLSFRPEPEALSKVVGKGEMVLLHGELMPIFRLHKLFSIEGASEDPTKALLIVVDDGERGYALLADEILGQQHVVAKSLGEGIGKVHGISGGAILGDGRVGLILDAMEFGGLARQRVSPGHLDAIKSTITT